MTKVRLPKARPVAALVAAIGVASLAPGAALAADNAAVSGSTNINAVATADTASTTDTETETTTLPTTDGASAQSDHEYMDESGQAASSEAEVEVDGGNSGEADADQEIKLEAQSGDSGDSGDGGNASSSNEAVSGNSGSTGGNTAGGSCVATGDDASCTVTENITSGDSGDTGDARNTSTTHGGNSGNTGATGMASISKDAIGNISNSAVSGDTNVNATAMADEAAATAEETETNGGLINPLASGDGNGDVGILNGKNGGGSSMEAESEADVDVEGGNSGEADADQEVNMEAESGDSGDSGDGGNAESSNTAVSGNSGDTGGNSSEVDCVATGEGAMCIINVTITSGDSGDTGDAVNTSTTMGGNSGATGATGGAHIGDVITVVPEEPVTPTEPAGTTPTNEQPAGAVAGVSATPVMVASTGAAVTAVSGQLPFTGLPMEWLAAIALLLMGVGALVQRAARLRVAGK